MKKQSICLNGEWSLCWLDVGKGSITGVDELFQKEQVVACSVPGDIHAALAKAGVIKEPLVDKNSEDCRWLEEKEFWYRKEFRVEEGFQQDVTELFFEGLDLTADVWLNGHYLGSHNNAFVEKVFTISDSIQTGENVLVVRIDDGVHGVRDKSVELMKYSWNNDQPYRTWMRKPQFVYGWDWTIWMPTCGIWKGVSIHSYEKAAIKDYHVETKFMGEDITKADKVILKVAAELRLFRQEGYVLKCEIYDDERYETAVNCVAAGRVEISAQEYETIEEAIELILEEPRLWWPNGAGTPYLYQVKVWLEDENGQVLQEEWLQHGIRSVSIREEVLDEYSKSFTYVINGTPIFAKGANHVPADCLLGRITEEKNRKLLTMAAEANMNMIRVWGGGIYESEGFMKACDELGIMVWHDFMFACGYYPDYDTDFFEEIRKEATAAIRRLRKHSSLVGWSGNNEIQEMYTSAKQGGRDIPWYGGRFYEELLPQLVQELCPDRIYRESSPFGGVEPTSYEEGDQHTWHFTHRPGWEHYLDLWRFTDFDFKFLSEFGIIGAMNIETARKCIRPEALFPGSEEWRHHTNSSGSHELVDIFVKKYFDVTKDINLQEYILKSQVIQAEMMRHVYDELRSRKFRCSGVLLWTLSDSYGINNWSVIDYYLGKRPIYYYLKRALAPLNVSFRGYEVQNFDGMAGYKEYYKGKVNPIEVFVTSDVLMNKEVVLEYRVLTMDGRKLMSGAYTKIIPANSVEKCMEVDISQLQGSFLPEETFLYVQVCEGDTVLSENRYFFAPYKDLQLPEATVTYALEGIGEHKAELTLQADGFVWMLHIADTEGIELGDNDFDLLNNQKKVITIEGKNIVDYAPQMYSLNPHIKMVKG